MYSVPTFKAPTKNDIIMQPCPPPPPDVIDILTTPPPPLLFSLVLLLFPLVSGMPQRTSPRLSPFPSDSGLPFTYSRGFPYSLTWKPSTTRRCISERSSCGCLLGASSHSRRDPSLWLFRIALVYFCVLFVHSCVLLRRDVRE